MAIGFNDCIVENRSRELVQSDLDRFAHYREKHVEVAQNGIQTWGVYRGQTVVGTILLQPYVEHVGLSPREQTQFGIPCILRWNSGCATLNCDSMQAVLERDVNTMNERINACSIRDEPLDSP